MGLISSPESSSSMSGPVRLVALLTSLLMAGSSLVGADSEVLRQVANSQSLEQNLRTICDELGPRLTGSSAMQRAAQWGVGQFRAAGTDAAWLEQFEIPRSWSDGGVQIDITAPVSFRVEAVATAWSPATADGDPVEFEIVRSEGLGAGSVRRLGDRAKGRAVLVLLDEAKSFYAMGMQQSHAMLAMREAGEVGAAVVLFASFKPDRILFRHTHTVDARVDPVPSAVLGREDALRIGRLLEGNAVLKARIAISSVVGGPSQGANVVAEIRGSERPDEVVVLGAHLDSWDLGTGCLDNGVNVALVMEAARAIVASGKRPKRTIRFILFDGEEAGLFGSRAYVRRHRDELDSVIAVVVHDMGQDRIQGYSLGGRPELESGLRTAMSSLNEAPGMRHTRTAFLGSDHFDFQVEGIPALVAIQDTDSYVVPYHSDVDTFDKVDIQLVRANTRVAAATVFGIAESANGIGQRLDRDEVADMLRRSGLEDQMKFLGLWAEWESGERGRENEGKR
jgi:carboxypeptidase Q